MSAIDDAESTSSTTEEVPDINADFDKYKKIVKAGWGARKKWRERAKTCFGYVAGHQWSDADMAILKDQNRPAITFNRVAPIVRAVCGLEVNNRQGVVYLPREMGDVGIDELLTSTAKWVRDNTNADRKESVAFRDLVICGEGVTETRLEHDDDPEGKIVKERILPTEMGVNKGACKPNYEDARVMFRVRDMDAADAREILGVDLADKAMHCSWLQGTAAVEDGGEGNKRDYPDETRSGVETSLGRSATGQVRIVQVQYWERAPRVLVAQEGVTELQTLTEEDFQKFEERAAQLNEVAAMSGSPAMSYNATKVQQKVYYECFLVESAMVGKRELPFNSFQWKFMTGEYDEEEKFFIGLVGDMLDPQMWANKWLSQTMNILNTNAKGGLIVEQDAFINPRKAEKEWSDPTKMIMVKPGAIAKQKIKERQSMPLPQGLNDLMIFAISSIRDVSGVNLELLGQADREQAASLEAQRRQSAMTVLATLFDSLRSYRIDDGRLLLHFIQQLPEGTLVRVQGKDSGTIKYVPLVKNKDISKYDVIIDQAPSSPDQKQYVWAVTAQLLQMNILPPPAIAVLLKYSPYPDSVAKEIQNAMGMGDEEPQALTKQKLAQAEQALQFLENELKKALEEAKKAKDTKSVDVMEATIKAYQARTERLKVLWDDEAEGGDQGDAEPLQDADVMDIDGPSADDRIANLEQQVQQLVAMLQGGGGAPPVEQAAEPMIEEQ